MASDKDKQNGFSIKTSLLFKSACFAIFIWVSAEEAITMPSIPLSEKIYFKDLFGNPKSFDIFLAILESGS